MKDMIKASQDGIKENSKMLGLKKTKFSDLKAGDIIPLRIIDVEFYLLVTKIYVDYKPKSNLTFLRIDCTDKIESFFLSVSEEDIVFCLSKKNIYGSNDVLGIIPNPGYILTE
jgi:hypothetical protein